MRRGSLLFVILLFHFFGWGNLYQTTNHLGVNEGLSQSSANSIVQDEYGFLWIATHDGLNRYDGHSFKTFNVSDFDSTGFQSNTINCLNIFDKGFIWFGTQAGAYCLDQKTEEVKAFHFQATKQETRGYVNVISMVQSKKNQQIFALTEHALYKLNTQSGKFDSTTISISNDNLFTTLFASPNGEIWVGSKDGLYLLDSADNILKQITANWPSEFSVKALFGTDKTLFIGTQNGLFQFNYREEPQIITSTQGIAINTIHIDDKDEIWIGTNNGVFVLNSKTLNIVKRYALQNGTILSDNIQSITEDQFNQIWIGTGDKGIISIDTNEQFIKLVFDPHNILKHTSSIAPTPNGDLLVSSSSNGFALISIDEYGNSLRAKPIITNGFSSNQIKTMETDGNYYYAALEQGGLVVAELKGSQLNVIQSLQNQQLNISNIIADRQGKIWLTAINEGLFYYNKLTKSIEKVKLDLKTKQTPDGSQKTLNDVHPTVLALGSKGLWFGNQMGGIGHVTFGEDGTGVVTCIDKKEFISVSINCLHEINGKLWIGTQSKGIYSFNISTGEIQHFDRSKGLNNEVVHAIDSDSNGNIWFSTNHGLVKYEVLLKEFFTFSGTNYLQGYEFTDGVVFQSKQGELFFAGINGINYFNPAATQSSTSKPLVQLSDLLINNISIKAGQVFNNRIVLSTSILNTNQIDLYHGDNMISFVVSPIHYADSRNNSFAYKLEKYDKEWVHRNAENRYINYSNLKGGTYTLRIRAVSSDGQWSDERQISIKVHPPIWERTWFQIIMYLLAFSLVGTVFGIAYLNQKKKRNELEHEKSLLQSLMDNIPDTIYFKDLQSKFIRINKAQARLLKINDPSEAIGKSDYDYFEHAEESFAEEQEIIKTGKPVVNSMHMHELEGQIKYMSDTKIALHDQYKNCIGTVGITRDMTELILAEEAMKESQSKFKALFDNAPLAFFRLDQNQFIVESNHRFRKMFGFSNEEELGEFSIEDILVDPEISLLIFETVLETKEVNTELMLKRKNGESFIANMTMALLEEGFKEITIEGIIEDVTQMVKAREEIVRAKDDAIEANRLKSMFLANMSHEVRTPMNAIIGFTNMLREPSNSEEETNSFIDVIQSNGQSLMTLIDSIVDFSKLEADQMGISKSEFNLNSLIDTIYSDAHKSLSANFKDNIKLTKSINEEKACRIFTDRHRLNQVLNHLVSNAVKFTDDGEIEIGYHINGDRIKIFVRDTGIGIAKNHHNVIFERFTKVNEDKNRLYGGTGIGLTISKGLVELMGGTIALDSELNKGALFTIDIPIGIQEE